MRSTQIIVVSTFAAALLFSAPVRALPLGSATTFLPSYTGPQNDDLKVESAEAFFGNGNFSLDATFGAPVGTTTDAFYVWGIDRGTGAQGFGAFNPGVTFDAVVIFGPIAPGITLAVDDFVNDTFTPLPMTDVSIMGDSLDLTVPEQFLPSIGLFAPADYLVNLWPRVGLDASDNSQIADFDPATSDVPVTALPESQTWITLIAGFAALSLSLRMQRRKTVAIG